MVLINQDKGRGQEWKSLNFRPLAGIMVLIDGDEFFYEYAGHGFPSPCGDYGSYLRERK